MMACASGFKYLDDERGVGPVYEDTNTNLGKYNWDYIDNFFYSYI